jgi:hypothetical protein
MNCGNHNFILDEYLTVLYNALNRTYHKVLHVIKNKKEYSLINYAKIS